MPSLAELRDLIPMEEDEDGKNRMKLHAWRKTVGWTTMYNCIGVSFLLWAAFLSVPKLGGLAWSEERNRVNDAKIASAVEPLKQEISVVKANQERLAKDVRVARASALVGQIYDAKKQLCEARDQGRSTRIWTERLAELRDEYATLVEKVAEVPNCEDLR